MWYKWIIGIFIVIGISLILRSGEVKPVKNEGISDISRLMTKVCMSEKNLDNDSSIELYTDKAIQYSDDNIYLQGFELHTNKGVHMKGEKAYYYINQSSLKILGPIIIETKDGDKAYMDGLIWDRKSNTVNTDSPIKIEGRGILVEAKKAQFGDDFNLLSFSGGVNAKIYNNYLTP